MTRRRATRPGCPADCPRARRCRPAAGSSNPLKRPRACMQRTPRARQHNERARARPQAFAATMEGLGLDAAFPDMQPRIYHIRRACALGGGGSRGLGVPPRPAACARAPTRSRRMAVRTHAPPLRAPNHPLPGWTPSSRGACGSRRAPWATTWCAATCICYPRLRVRGRAACPGATACMRGPSPIAARPAPARARAPGLPARAPAVPCAAHRQACRAAAPNELPRVQRAGARRGAPGEVLPACRRRARHACQRSARVRGSVVLSQLAAGAPLNAHVRPHPRRAQGLVTAFTMGYVMDRRIGNR